MGVLTLALSAGKTYQKAGGRLGLTVWTKISVKTKKNSAGFMFECKLIEGTTKLHGC